MGTYNGTQSSLAAASATLEILENGHTQEQLKRVTQELQQGFSQICEEMNVSARLDGLAGQFQVYFTDREIENYRRKKPRGDCCYMPIGFITDLVLTHWNSVKIYRYDGDNNSLFL